MTGTPTTMPENDRGVCLLQPRPTWPVLAMCVAVLAVYCPLSLLDGAHTLVGMDFSQLHTHRIRYAQEALFGSAPHLPAWHSRELLGSPFWSNIQNFPFIPTRLVLLALNPYVAFAAGVNIAALLAAIFTYLYGRRIGLGTISAAVAGWTFAASGFFSSRVMAGHLPLLEAYPALPLLLWLIERNLQSAKPAGRFSADAVWLGVASMCIILAGHPQLPIYAFSAGLLYLAFRGRCAAGFRAAAAIACGIGMASFALVPMFALIRRSTRLLRLDEPANNVFFPFRRLAAFLFPWRDGAAPGVQVSGVEPFHGYPNMAFFWDTFCYVGWLPILAAAFLLFRRETTRALPPRPWILIVIGGSLATLLALPFMQQMLAMLPGTLLRSPARQLYITTFALSLGSGAAMEAILRFVRSKNRFWLVAPAAALAIHFTDLGAHSRCFVQTTAVPTTAQRAISPDVLSLVGNGRVAIDYPLQIPWNRDLDDVGFFDSIMLATAYETILAINGAPPGLNIQDAFGSMFNKRSLAYAGVRLVITTSARADLPQIGSQGNLFIYSVPDALPRAHFISQRDAQFLDHAEVIARLRDQNHDLAHGIMLYRDAAPASRAAGDATTTADVQYRRPTESSIAITVTARQSGYARLIESWDPGWKAWLNGKPAPVLCADNGTIAIGIAPGVNEIELRFETPGSWLGLLIAAGSFVALLFLAARPMLEAATGPIAAA